MAMLRAMAIVAAVLASGCAGANGAADTDMAAARSPDAERSCFWPSAVNGFTDAGRDRVYVHTGPNDVYLFEIFGTCPDLNFTEKLALKTRGSGMVCSGLDVDLIVPSTIGPQRCPVRMIHKLSEAERAALRNGN